MCDALVLGKPAPTYLLPTFIQFVPCSMSITQQPKLGLNDKFFIGLNFELGAGKGLIDLLGHISKLTGYFAPNISERRKIDCLRMSVGLSLKRIIENILALDESYFLQEFGLSEGDLGDDVSSCVWQSPSSGVSHAIVPNSRSYAISFDVVCHELFRVLGFRNVRTTLENMVKHMRLEDTSLIAIHNIEFQLGVDRLREFGGEAVRLDDSLRWYGSSLPVHVSSRLTCTSSLRSAMAEAVALVETSDTFGFPKAHKRATPTAAIAAVGTQPDAVLSCAEGACKETRAMVEGLNHTLESGGFLNAIVKMVPFRTPTTKVRQFPESAFNDLVARSKRVVADCVSPRDVVNAFTHLTPTQLFRETVRTTSTKAVYNDLDKKNPKELKSMYDNQNMIGRFKRQRNDSDDEVLSEDDEEEEVGTPPPKKSKESRPVRRSRRDTASPVTELVDVVTKSLGELSEGLGAQINALGKAIGGGYGGNGGSQGGTYGGGGFGRGNSHSYGGSQGGTYGGTYGNRGSGRGNSHTYGGPQGNTYGGRGTGMGNGGFRGAQSGAYTGRGGNSTVTKKSFSVNYSCKKCKDSNKDGHRTARCSQLYDDNGNSLGPPCCHYCGEEHVTKDCPEIKKQHCLSCGEAGHKARFCPKYSSTVPADRPCFSCGKPGHLARDCKAGSTGNGNGGGGGARR